MARRRGRPLGGSYEVYKRDYEKLATRLQGKVELEPMLSEQAYQGRYGKLRDQERADKEIGIINKNTSVNINKQILDEQTYDPFVTKKSARATYRAMKDFRDSEGKAIFKNVTLRDIRAGERALSEDAKETIDSFWKTVHAEWYASGKDSEYIARLFFGSP